ncbi:MAG: rhomboid family intramembrane serine protease, partial [Bacteroidota bacterium]|nr:rhomboid family intramembrane serine protease [Bacteroidota bacterium]
MTRISEEIRNQFTQGDHLNRLILINVGVFVLLLIIKVFAALFQAPGLLTGIMDWITLPSDPMTFITRPWTLVTYMFTHLDFFHILFNLLILYFTGKIFLDF